VVLLDHDDVPPAHVREGPELAYARDWSANSTAGIRAAAPRHGFFSAACFIHTSFDARSPLIDGASFLDVLGRWYFQRSGAHRAMDGCGLFCNPTCAQP
jgi:hypothetical protein